MTSGFVVMATAGPATAGDDHIKVWICKYSHTPERGEEAQTVNSVDYHEGRDPGTWGFEDAQGFTFVYGYSTGPSAVDKPDNAEDCPPFNPPGVTAVAPTVSGSQQCEVQGTYTIPATEGVQYKLDGADIAPGTYNGPEDGTVTAVAEADFELTNPGFSYVIELPAAEECPDEVTAVAPTVSRSQQCGVQGTYTIPATEGVQYMLDEEDIAPGTYNGPKAGTVTAVAEAGHTLTNPEFSFTLDLPAAATCPTNPPPPPPPPGPELVTPGVTFTDATCADLDGAGFDVDGLDKVAYALTGTVAPGNSVSLVASPRAGFAFPVGAETEFEKTFASIDSLNCPSEEPTVGGTETSRPKPEKKPRGPVVLGTQAGVPTAVDAGLAGMPAESSTVSQLGLLLVGGGAILLLSGGWMGLGRRNHGVHEA